MTRQNYDKQTLINSVYCAVLDSSEPLTRHEICRAIGRRKSPHIIHIIEELTKGGWFIRDEIEDAKYGTAFIYKAGRVPEISEPVMQTLDSQ